MTEQLTLPKLVQINCIYSDDTLQLSYTEVPEIRPNLNFKGITQVLIRHQNLFFFCITFPTYLGPIPETLTTMRQNRHIMSIAHKQIKHIYILNAASEVSKFWKCLNII